MKNKLFKNAIIAFLFLGASLFARESTSDFVKNILSQNKTISKIVKADVVSTQKIGKIWYRDVVKVQAVTKRGDTISTFMPILTDGHYFVQDIYDVNGNPISKDIKIDTKQLYKESNLIYSPKDKSKIKNKIAIFSDFECPYCNEKAYPELKKMVESGNTAIYYYNFPISSIHPNAKNISLCVITALNKYKTKKIDIIERIYMLKYFQHTQNEKVYSLNEMVNIFNVIVPFSKITAGDILKYNAEEKLNKEMIYTTSIGVVSTPTIFKNGIKENLKR